MHKICKHCNKIKTLNEFYHDKSRHDGYNVRCKECCDEATKSWRKRNPGRANCPGRTKITGAKNRTKYRQLWKEIIREKNLDECRKCGYNACFAAISHHHLNPEEKKYCIGHLLDKKPTMERVKELDKIIPLCCRCHREYHSGMWELDETMVRRKEENKSN